MTNNCQVKCILLFSGKRKCGKDYITDKLYEKLGSEKTAMIKISAPIKKCWAEMNNLQFDELLTAGPAKEEHRLEMIKWSENIRNTDPGIFCRTAITMNNAETKSIWIVSDVRRRSDIEFFLLTYGKDIVKLIRISADDDVRKTRGWLYTDGIDNKASECDLDEFKDWDFQVENNGGNPQEIADFINDIIELSNSVVHESKDES